MTQPATSASVVRYLKAAVGPDADGPADAELLARFVADRDQGAFELLVWRHAAMVLRTCRGVLRDHHAAEDATQAAFLALARKAGAIGRREAVAAWLYRVAYRVAVRAAVRRARTPVPSAADLDRLPATHAAEPGSDPDAVRALLDEVARLPDKYRSPVLLCFFDGLSHADAARRLGWPVGTVAGRIARAKDRLHRRLTRRGVAVPAAGLAALVSADPAAAVAPSFAGVTARAAVVFAAGRGSVPEVSNTVLELTREAIRAMTATKLLWAAGVLAACGVVTFGGVWAAGQGPAAGPADPSPVPVGAAARPNEPAPKADAADRRATATQRQRSLKNLRQILLAIHNYHDAHGHFPSDVRDKDGKPLLSWRVVLLLYMEQKPLARQFKMDEPWDSEHNWKLLAQMPDVYRVGFEPKGATHTYYQGFSGPGTWLDLAGAGAPGAEGGRAVPGGEGAAAPAWPAGDVNPARGRIGVRQIFDGTVSTLGVVEAGPPVPWTKPADIPYDPKKPVPKFDGPFTNALHVATLSSDVYGLRRDLGDDLLRRLIERADGDFVPDLKELQADVPPVTEEEQAALKGQIDQNRLLVHEIERLMKDHVALLRGRNEWSGDLVRAEEQAKELGRMAESLRAVNKKLRDEMGLRGQFSLPPQKE